MRMRLRLILASALVTALAACVSEKPGPTPEPGTVGIPTGSPSLALIGPEGGSLTSMDGRLTLSIPEGALDAEHTLGIQAISNTAPHGTGSAYRLAPEGVSFARPVTITFDHSLPGGHLIAYQDEGGVWQGLLNTVPDPEAGTISVQSTHFSDWSVFEAFSLSPQSAVLYTGDVTELTVQACVGLPEDPGDFLAPLLPTCRPMTLAPLIQNAAVNGVPGGNATVGTLIHAAGQPTLQYAAPGSTPASNPVAVSVEVRMLGSTLLLLVADITVNERTCTGRCQYQLHTFDGEDLPSPELPRNSWENPERVTGGVLTLHDAQGAGAGTYSLRIEWLEDRGNGSTLAQFMQDAGNYRTNDSGEITFESLAATSFAGSAAGATVEVYGFPLWTSNTNVEADLSFRR